MPAKGGRTPGIGGNTAAPALSGDPPVSFPKGPGPRGLECSPSQSGFSPLELAGGGVWGCVAKLGHVGSAELPRSPGEEAGPGEQHRLDVEAAEALLARPALSRCSLLLPYCCRVG